MKLENLILIDDGSRQRTLSYGSDEVDSIVFDSNTVGDYSNVTGAKTVTDGNTTIITVGGNKPTVIEPARNDSQIKTVPPKTTVITSAPISLKIPVLADNTTNGWTNSGWVHT